MIVPPIKDYIYETFLGEGATGQVYLGKRGDRSVAIKILKRLGINRKLLGYSLSRLQALPQHPALVEIVDFGIRGRPLYVATSLHIRRTKDGRLEGFSLESQSGGMDPELAWAIIRQMCEGMAHLHQNGVVHGSLNPKNVMVANPDTPEVRLTDFAQGWLPEITHIDFSESFLYAAPEQLRKPGEMFEGQGQRWDAYAFGVTAFRLLYNQFPRAQPWISEMREGLVSFHPLAYAEAVGKQPEIHWPSTKDGFEEQRQRVLEKCLMVDPSDRCSDLREALERFKKIERDEKHGMERRSAQERERVLSERLDAGYRRVRYFRKVSLWLLGCLTVSVLFNLTSESRLAKWRHDFSGLEDSTKLKVDAAERREAQSLREAERSKRNLAYSQETADSFLDFLLQGKSPDSPEFQSIDDHLEAAREHYESVLRTTEGDEALVIARLRAQLGVARIELQWNRSAAAASKLGTLVDEIRTLPDSIKQVTEVQETLAAALVETGKARMVGGRRTGALQSLKESVTVYKKLVAADEGNLPLKRKFGKALLLYGQQLSWAGDLETGRKSLQGATQVLETLVQSSLSREEDQYYLAMCQFEVGLIRLWENEGIEAFEAFRLASQGYSRLMEAKPRVPEYQFQLARCFYYLGELSFQEKGDEEESASAREATRELLLRLLQREEANRNYQFYLARVQADLAQMARNAGEREKAAEDLDQASTILSELRKSDPSDANVAFHLALTTAAQADLLLEAKKTNEALQRISRAEELFHTVDASGAHPSVPDHVYQFGKAEVTLSHGQILESAGEAAKALSHFERCLKILTELAAKRPNDGKIKNLIDDTRRLLAPNRVIVP